MEMKGIAAFGRKTLIPLIPKSPFNHRDCATVTGDRITAPLRVSVSL
jgi:hypothetical protein